MPTPPGTGAVSGPEPLLGGEHHGQRTAGLEWRLQQLGWVAMALVVVLALLGVFGTGPLSWSRAVADDGSIEVEYQRFVRNGGDNTLSVRVPASAVDNGEARVWLSNEYVSNVELAEIVPQPRSQVAEGDGVVLVFEVAEGATGLEATVSATADAIGLQQSAIGVSGRVRVAFSQLFYP